MESSKLISVSALITSSFGLAIQNFGLFIRLILIVLFSVGFFAALVTVGGLSLSTPFIITLEVFFGAMTIVTCVAAVVGLFGLMYALVNQEQRLGLYHSSRLAWPLLWSIVWVGILSQLIQSTGTVLFIVPMLIFSVYAGLAQYVVMNEEYRGLDALVRATHMVYGRFWAVLGRLLVIIILWILLACLIFIVGIGLISLFAGTPVPIQIIGYVLGAVLIGFTFLVPIAASVNLYRSEQTTAPKETFVKEEWASVRKWYKIAAWAGIVAIVVLNMADAKLQEAFPWEEGMTPTEIEVPLYSAT